MGKQIIPTFIPGITAIAGNLSYGCEGDHVTYYHGLAPVFAHDRSDQASFRMILSQFYVNGAASQARLVSAFGINALALKRWVKQYRAEGTRSFFDPRPRKSRAPAGSKKNF